MESSTTNEADPKQETMQRILYIFYLETKKKTGMEILNSLDHPVVADWL